jgi:hypothetical protein
MTGMKLVALAVAVPILFFIACADPSTVAGPPRVPDDTPTANDPDLQSSHQASPDPRREDGGAH